MRMCMDTCYVHIMLYKMYMQRLGQAQRAPAHAVDSKTEVMISNNGTNDDTTNNSSSNTTTTTTTTPNNNNHNNSNANSNSNQ